MLSCSTCIEAEHESCTVSSDLGISTNMTCSALICIRESMHSALRPRLAYSFLRARVHPTLGRSTPHSRHVIPARLTEPSLSCVYSMCRLTCTHDPSSLSYQPSIADIPVYHENRHFPLILACASCTFAVFIYRPQLIAQSLRHSRIPRQQIFKHLSRDCVSQLVNVLYVSFLVSTRLLWQWL